MKKKGISRSPCPRHNVDYVGETARNFDIRHKEHFKAAEVGRYSHSGLTQHLQNCDAPIEGPEILSVAKKTKDKGKLKFDLRVEESLWIRRQNCGPGHGMNEDWGSYTKSYQWAPVFHGM